MPSAAFAATYTRTRPDSPTSGSLGTQFTPQVVCEEPPRVCVTYVVSREAPDPANAVFAGSASRKRPWNAPLSGSRTVTSKPCRADPVEKGGVWLSTVIVMGTVSPGTAVWATSTDTLPVPALRSNELWHTAHVCGDPSDRSRCPAKPGLAPVDRPSAGAGLRPTTATSPPRADRRKSARRRDGADMTMAEVTSRVSAIQTAG